MKRLRKRKPNKGGKNAKQIKAEEKAAERIRKSKERRQTEIAKGRNPNKKGKQARIFDEWDELAKEERLYKKLKRNKITKRHLRSMRKIEVRGEQTQAKGLEKSQEWLEYHKTTAK
eukprot:scaffold249326_cov50-Cyclotella_meneghiniana.AAC.7